MAEVTKDRLDCLEERMGQLEDIVEQLDDLIWPFCDRGSFSLSLCQRYEDLINCVGKLSRSLEILIS